MRVAAQSGLRGISVELPAVVRLSKDREAMLELRIRNERQVRKQIRLALALPREIDSVQEDVRVALPAASEWSRLAWPCTPRRRGNYLLDAVHVEGRRRWGSGRCGASCRPECEVRVYPNLLHGAQEPGGAVPEPRRFRPARAAAGGQGPRVREAARVCPGDSYDEIHWKATRGAASRSPRCSRSRRTQEIYVVIDASRLSARETVASSKFPVPGSPDERGVATWNLRTCNLQPTPLSNASSRPRWCLGLAAEQQGDLFGLLTFTDRVENFVRAKNGKAHYSACRDALYTLQPQIVSPDFDELCTFIRLRLRRRALLVFLTRSTIRCWRRALCATWT